MGLARSVLLVSSSGPLTDALGRTLRHAGYRLVIARTFHAAKSQLAESPDLIVTELKLAEYNGLQLALRGRAAGIPAIVVADDSFEHDVEQLGAHWISPEMAVSDDVERVIAQALQNAPIHTPCVWYDGSCTDKASAPLPDFPDSLGPVLH